MRLLELPHFTSPGKQRRKDGAKWLTGSEPDTPSANSLPEATGQAGDRGPWGQDLVFTGLEMSLTYWGNRPDHEWLSGLSLNLLQGSGKEKRTLGFQPRAG